MGPFDRYFAGSYVDREPQGGGDGVRMAKALPPSASYGATPALSVPTISDDRSAVLMRSLRSLAAVAFAGSWIGFYLITPLPYLALDTFRATVILHAVTGLVLVPYVCSLVARRRLPGGSPLDLPVLALIGVLLLTTATSVNWRFSLEVSLTVLMAVAIFCVLSDGGLFRSWQVEGAFVLAALAAALNGLWIVAGDYLDWLRLNSAVSGGFSWSDVLPPTVPEIHDVSDFRNYLGVILAMSFPFLVAAALRPWHWILRLLGALAGLTVLMAIFLTLTRSTWIAAGVGGLTTLVLLTALTDGGRALLRQVWPASPRRRLTNGAALIIIIGAAIALLSVAAPPKTQPYWLFRPSLGARADALGAGAEMVQDYPLLGTGPGAYRLLYPEYSQKNLVHAIHAHNGFLQVAVDMGIPGVLTMIALIAVLSWLLLRSLVRAEGHARFSIAASAGAFVAFAVFSQFDAPNTFKAPLAALAVVGAVAVLRYRETIPAPKYSAAAAGLAEGMQLAARGVLPIVLVGLLITWGRLDVAQFEYSNSLHNANAHRWSASANQARRAVELDPSFAIYHLQYGNVLGQGYVQSGNTGLLNDAVAQLQRGLALESRSAIGHTNLALLYASAGQRELARDEANAAIRYASSDPAVVLAAANALETADWQSDAIRAYAAVLFIDGDLADSAFWQGSAFRRAHFAEIVSSSAVVFSPCAVLVLASKGLPERPLAAGEALAACRQYVDAHPRDLAAKVTLAGVLIEGGSLGEASALLKLVTDREPDFAPARTALGRLYEAEGDLDRARREWVRGGQLKDTDSLVLLGDSYAAGQVPPEVVDALRARLNEAASAVQFDLTSILYFRYKFYRESPVNMLLPGDWQTAVPGRFARAYDALQRWTAAP